MILTNRFKSYQQVTGTYGTVPQMPTVPTPAPGTYQPYCSCFIKKLSKVPAGGFNLLLYAKHGR